MPQEVVYLTRQGLQQIKDEYAFLITTKRHEVAKSIQAAKEFGDLSENAEYENAKNQQAFVEGRIATLEKMIANAALIDEQKKSGANVVVIGRTITVFSKKHNQDQTYSIVGSAESDPVNGKISNASPMGQALLGHSVGDTVSIPTPSGVNEVTIKKIS